MEFYVAALLLYGKAGLNEFNDEVVNRPEVQAMIERIHFGVSAEAEAAGYDKMTSILDIHLNFEETGARFLSGRSSPRAIRPIR